MQNTNKETKIEPVEVEDREKQKSKNKTLKEYEKTKSTTFLLLSIFVNVVTFVVLLLIFMIFNIKLPLLLLIYAAFLSILDIALFAKKVNIYASPTFNLIIHILNLHVSILYLIFKLLGILNYFDFINN